LGTLKTVTNRASGDSAAGFWTGGGSGSDGRIAQCNSARRRREWKFQQCAGTYNAARLIIRP
jgi:hypothetical protein